MAAQLSSASMDDLVLLVDFGSTYTKVLAVDMDKAEVVGRSQSPTTVNENMLTGLRNALDQLTVRGRRPARDTLDRARKLASSSAAGGLAIVAVGLVPDLTLEAAKKAALGAGAKVVGSHGYELDEQALDDIERSRCDIVLLVGGIDGGNKDVILHNARMLATRQLDVPFIVAGNRSAADAAKRILEDSGKYVERTDNVLPELDRLVVEPARACIRDIFIRNIVRAKGLEKAQDYLGNILMPTPMATLKASALLAGGHGGDAGFGELMVVEVGGATTNVHSVAKGEGSAPNTLMKGLADPYDMRTVEGDLGIRYNARTILDVIGVDRVLDHAGSAGGLDAQALRLGAQLRSQHVDYVPDNAMESAIDIALARSAVEVAVERHVGTIRESWGVEGVVRIQTGKDLTGLRTVIGTGGIFSHHPDARRILEAALMTPKSPFSLKPRSADFYLDRDYVLYGIGLLSAQHPDVALRMSGA
jgi:uncharacterized protein (TIGR01319 family)